MRQKTSISSKTRLQLLHIQYNTGFLLSTYNLFVGTMFQLFNYLVF